MAHTIKRVTVRCPNCDFIGRARMIGTGSDRWFILATAWLIALKLFPDLFPILLVATVWLTLKPASPICPRCEFPHPIPIPAKGGNL